MEHHSPNGTNMSIRRRLGHVSLALFLSTATAISPSAWAGAFTFAGENNGVGVITHPIGYFGSGGVLQVGVCIDPASAFIDELVIPVQNNISVWNDLQPVQSNVQLDAVSGIDAESVLLHEIGHCIGLAHVNAASESGLSGSDLDYTKATDGANNSFDINPGPDGVKGSHDDIRGDDVNLHWFNPFNDPFMLPIPTPVDTSLYKRDLSFLPPGDSFAQNASRQLASHLGIPSAEAVMQQGSYSGETQRELMGDGAATIMLGASGLDETAGTSDDYQLQLTYEGVGNGSNCDITVIMESFSGLAYCSTGGAFVGNGHVRITSASVHLSTQYTWAFNDVPRGGGNQPPSAVNDGATVDEDDSVYVAVLDNDSDPDGDPLDVISASSPPNGYTAVTTDDTVLYIPNPNFNGADSFTYTISDGNGGSDSATVNVTVNPVNDPPEASNDSGINTAFDTPVDIDVLANDTDVEGDALSVESAANGSNGTVVNHGSHVTYQPNPGFSGADNFNYTVSDGNPGGTGGATVYVTVAAPNQSPTAAFTSSCTGLSCSFDASGSFDPDGSISSYSWDFGDGNGGSGVGPNHGYAAPGDYSVTLTVQDNLGASDDVSNPVSVTAGPDVASADWSTPQGNVSGTYQATQSAGNGSQTISETHSGGRPSLRSDSFEHIWQFNLTGGNTVFNVDATASFPSGDADSEVRFEWAPGSSGPWTSMVSVNAGSSGYQTFDTGSASGTVYVRAVDADATQGNTVYSSVSVDHMFFDGGSPPSDPPGAASSPSPSNGASGVPVSTLLSWSAGLDTVVHDVYLGTSPASLSLVSSDQDNTSFDPPGDLNTSTTYYWRVDEQNSVGVTAGPVWSFTTSSSAGPTELVISNISTGTVNAGKGQKHGQAVVTVVDDFGNPISGVTVSGTFSGSYNESGADTTGGGGEAVITSAATVKGGVSFTFCVDTISGGSLPYNQPPGSDCASY